MEEYMEVYSILFDVDILLIEDYEYLISVYGKSVVDLVIDDLINEDEDNAYRFEVKYSKRRSVDKTGSVAKTIFEKDLSMYSSFNAGKNLELMKEIHEVILELEQIFKMLNFDDSVLDKRRSPWISDKVDYCLKECDDLAVLDKLKYLADKYNKMRNIIVMGNLKLVFFVANEYSCDSITSFIDIIQIGILGLMRAVEKYDFTKGKAFSSYAIRWIRGFISDRIYDIKYPTYISRGVVENKRMILEARNKLSIQLGREATYDDIAKYINKSALWIYETEKAFLKPVSLDEPIETDDGICTVGDLIADENADIYKEIYEKYLSKELREMLKKNLTRNQFFVIMYYFGFCEYSYGIIELGSILDITRQGVDSFKRTGLRRLKRKTNIMELATD